MMNCCIYCADTANTGPRCTNPNCACHAQEAIGGYKTSTHNSLTPDEEQVYRNWIEGRSHRNLRLSIAREMAVALIRAAGGSLNITANEAAAKAVAIADALLEKAE